MSKITVRIDEPTIEDLRSLLQLVDLFIDSPSVDTHLYAVAVTGTLADMPVIDPVPAPSPWLEVLKNLATGPEPEAVEDNADEPDDDQVLIVGSPVLTEALASIALDGDTRSEPDTPAKPPRQPRRPAPAKASIGHTAGRSNRYSDDRLKAACAEVNPDQPIGPQFKRLLGVSDGGVWNLHQRAIKAGWLPTPSKRGSDLGPMERRPFDPDKVKAGAILGIGNSGLD